MDFRKTRWEDWDRAEEEPLGPKLDFMASQIKACSTEGGEISCYNWHDHPPPQLTSDCFSLKTQRECGASL